MNFIYHGVPEKMIGTKLFPLNDMGTSMSNVRSKNLEKYAGREEILEREIPLLDCLWNGVVQLLPVHPQKLFELQKELGLISEIPPYSYFEIDVSTLHPSKSVVYFKTAPGEENVDVRWLADVDLSQLTVVPDATRAYYSSLVGKKEPVFNYQFVPHVVHKGVVDVSKARVITLGESTD